MRRLSQKMKAILLPYFMDHTLEGHCPSNFHNADVHFCDFFETTLEALANCRRLLTNYLRHIYSPIHYSSFFSSSILRGKLVQSSIYHTWLSASKLKKKLCEEGRRKSMYAKSDKIPSISTWLEHRSLLFFLLVDQNV